MSIGGLLSTPPDPLRFEQATSCSATTAERSSCCHFPHHDGLHPHITQVLLPLVAFGQGIVRRKQVKQTGKGKRNHFISFISFFFSCWHLTGDEKVSIPQKKSKVWVHVSWAQIHIMAFLFVATASQELSLFPLFFFFSYYAQSQCCPSHTTQGPFNLFEGIQYLRMWLFRVLVWCGKGLQWRP